MSAKYQAKTTAKTVSFLCTLSVFLAVQLWGFGAFASAPGDSARPEIFVSWTYIVGGLAAIIYKIGVGSAKHIVGRSFRYRSLLWPIAFGIVICLPLLFMIMPKFGPPTGHFWSDMIYAYLTTYAIIDMASDFFILSDIIRAKFQEAVDKDVRESSSSFLTVQIKTEESVPPPPSDRAA